MWVTSRSLLLAGGAAGPAVSDVAGSGERSRLRQMYGLRLHRERTTFKELKRNKAAM